MKKQIIMMFLSGGLILSMSGYAAESDQIEDNTKPAVSDVVVPDQNKAHSTTDESNSSSTSNDAPASDDSASADTATADEDY